MLWSVLAIVLSAQSPASPAPPPPAEAGDLSAQIEATAEAIEGVYLDHIIALEDEIARLREALAQAKLDASTAQRELAELHQFLADHQAFRDDFAAYQAVRAAAEEQARRDQIEEAKKRHEAEREAKRARRAAAQARKKAEDAERDRLKNYTQSGFSALGLDVWLGKSAFFYGTKDSTVRVKYDPDVGLFYRPDNRQAVDYSAMTISGSVLNSSNEVRNIGIGIVFFDENGYQVGGTTVQVNNARPDVPYPFTSQLDMALNRAFTSSTSYVLYADPVE
jgi:hypothetical protein